MARVAAALVGTGTLLPSHGRQVPESVRADFAGAAIGVSRTVRTCNPCSESTLLF